MSQPALAATEPETNETPEKELIVPEKDVVLSSATAFPLDAAPLFDRNETYRFPVLGDKFCEVRFPTDEEWAKRARSMATIVNTLGRGSQKWETDRKRELDADKLLFDKIRKDEGADFDEYEAKRIIDNLDRVLAAPAVREGMEYEIRLEWSPGSGIHRKLTHVLRMPTERLLNEYRQAASSSVNKRQTTEHKFFLEPSGELWGKLLVRVEGYVDPKHVPLNHKNHAVSELITTIEAEMDEGPAGE